MLAWLLSCFRTLFRPLAAHAEKLPTFADLQQAGRLIGQVSELTTAVAGEVGEHQSQIQNLNFELAAVAQGDAAAVAGVISKLLTANRDLQSRLERAELKLQAHSRQLLDVTVAARTDALTGLMNRRALDEELRRSLVECHRRGRPAALLLIDVDHFKQFNDTHGHVAGDEALKYVADVLRTTSRATDVVARFGGEEFAVLFAATTAAAVHQRAEAVRAAIGQGRVVVEGRQMRITASAGLAENAAGDEATQWLKRADDALYSAKGDGRNCTFWNRPGGLTRIMMLPRPDQAPPDAADDDQTSATEDVSVALAAEAFADATFIRQVGQRIAEWRRGGATFSILLSRLDCRGDAEEAGSAPPRRAVRVAIQLARGCIREMDVLTRWTSGGLAMLLPGAGVAEARVVARRLHAALAKFAARSEGPAKRVTIATGIAEGIEGNDADRVLQRAWQALESARSAGQGSIFLHDGLQTQPTLPLAATRT